KTFAAHKFHRFLVFHFERRVASDIGLHALDVILISRAIRGRHGRDGTCKTRGEEQTKKRDLASCFDHLGDCPKNSMAMGPRIMTKTIGKKKMIMGKRILTGIFPAISSARRKRRVRMSSA